VRLKRTRSCNHSTYGKYEAAEGNDEKRLMLWAWNLISTGEKQKNELL
jgi:hypothetical protein